MREWHTIGVALGLLLVMSFTCVGILSLWAATSPRHWFVRMAAVLAILTPLLFVPACEPFLVFALQAGVVAVGISMARWWHAQHSSDLAQGWVQTFRSARLQAVQFSLRTLLLLAVPIAAGALLFTRLPTLNSYAWSTILLDGVVAGLATLVAAWMFSTKRKLVVWPIAIVFCVLLTALPAWFEWLALSVTGRSGWPPSGPTGVMFGPLARRPVMIWFFVVPLVTVILTLILLCWGAGFGVQSLRDGDGARSSRADALRWLSKFAFVILVALSAVLPLAVTGKLLSPRPIPHVELPKPNGYNDLVAAGNMIRSPILDTTIEPKSTDELAAEIAKFAHVFDRIRLGLSRQSQAPIWPVDGDASKLISMSLPEIQAIRGAARALMREAQLADQQQRYDDCTRISLDCMRMGQASTRGGLLMHYLVGIAVEGIGDSALYPAIAQLNAATCRNTIVALREIEEHRESLTDNWYRDRIWDEHAYGWQGHLYVLLQDFAHEYGDTNWTIRQQVLPRKQAITRMLIIALALRAYQLEKGGLPDNLAQLVPVLLDQLPIDPFDPTGGPLRYKRTADGFELYSVGPNGVDDGGSAPEDEATMGMPTTGDLRLDLFLAPDTNPSADGDDSEEAATEPTTTDGNSP